MTENREYTVVTSDGEVVRHGKAEVLPEPPQGCLRLIGVLPPNAPSYWDGEVFILKPPPPSAHHIFNYTTKQWVDPRTLSDLQAAKWEQIKRDRDEAEFGGFTWDGSPFDSDAISQSRIQGAVQLAAMAPGFTIDWTLANNTVRNLTGEDLANVGAALGMHVAAQHAKARLLRSQIEAATTVAEVDAVTW